MTTDLNPQEIYLLERFISLNYFGEMRDEWAEMVAHVDSCLNRFMQSLPGRYRSRSLSEQPDAVWGQRVMPNFRETLDGLNIGFTLLAHGDIRGLDYAHGPVNDHKGQMDYWHGWMTPEDQTRYESLLEKAVTIAHTITVTEGAYWTPGTLANFPECLGDLAAPAKWPSYRVNRSVSVKTGEKTKRNGIYMPDVNHSCAQFLCTEYEVAPKATVVSGTEDLIDPRTGQKEGEQPTFSERDCTWYLVERDEQSGGGIIQGDVQILRVMGGVKCPEAGFYLTPATPGSRRHFARGELMPTLSNEYGTTIWQWDSDQT